MINSSVRFTGRFTESKVYRYTGSPSEILTSGAIFDLGRNPCRCCGTWTDITIAPPTPPVSFTDQSRVSRSTGVRCRLRMPPILEALAARVRNSARSSFHFTRMRRRHVPASTAFSPSLAPYVQSQATSLFQRLIFYAQARRMVTCRSDTCQQQHDSGMLEVRSAVRSARPMAFLLQPAVTSASAHSNYDQETPQKLTVNVSEDGFEGTWSLRMAMNKEIRSMASIHGEVHGNLFSPPFTSLAAARTIRICQPRSPNSRGFHSGTLPCRQAVPVEWREAGVLLPGLPSYCKVVEVGPRDGLQNESVFISAEVKGELINRLALAGLPVVEATSFVSILSVPQVRFASSRRTQHPPHSLTASPARQLADAREVMMNIAPTERTRFPVLTPNMRVRKRSAWHATPTSSHSMQPLSTLRVSRTPWPPGPRRWRCSPLPQRASARPICGAASRRAWSGTAKCVRSPRSSAFRFEGELHDRFSSEFCVHTIHTIVRASGTCRAL